MTSAIGAAVIGAAAAVIAAMASAWAGVRQKRTESEVEHVRISYQAMDSMLSNYRAENESLRVRLDSTEQRISTMCQQVQRCEEARSTLLVRMDEAQQEIARLQELVPGA